MLRREAGGFGDGVSRVCRDGLWRASGTSCRAKGRRWPNWHDRAEAKPGDSDAAADLALAWLERDDKPEARRWALAAKRIEPKQPVAAYVLARLQLSIGDEEAAIKLLEEALDKAAPNEEVLALVGVAEAEGGRCGGGGGTVSIGRGEVFGR